MGDQGYMFEGAKPDPREKNARERQAARDYMAAKRAEGRVIEIFPVRDRERRKVCANSLRLFCMTYFARAFYLELAPMHNNIIDELQEAILRGGKIALAAPRGNGKTTITIAAIIWAILYGYAKFIVLICAGGDMARDRLTEIKGYLDDPDGLLSADFPEVCLPIMDLQGSAQRAGKQTTTWKRPDGREVRRRTNIVWKEKDITFANVPSVDDPEAAAPAAGSIIVSRGLDATSIRGLLRGAARPDLVLLDDPQTDETARSEIQTDNLRNLIGQAVEGLAGPGMRLTIISLWTVIVAGDLADRYTSDEEPNFFSLRFKAVPKMPDDMKMVEEYVARVRDAKIHGDKDARAAHAWYLLNQDRIESGGVVGWEQNFIRADVGDRSMSEAFRVAGRPAKESAA